MDTANRWITGTGVMSAGIVVNVANSTGSGPQPAPQCLPVVGGSADGEAAWLSAVVATATAYEMQLVSLAQARDILAAEVVSSCPCEAPSPLQFYCDCEESGAEVRVARRREGGAPAGGRRAGRRAARRARRAKKRRAAFVLCAGVRARGTCAAFVRARAACLCARARRPTHT